MYGVFLFPSDAQSQAREALEDDLVSRQSISTRDAQALGTDLKGLLVVVEGEERAVGRFEELAGDVARRLTGTEAERAYNLLKKEEAEAAEGVGFLFGGG